jgi:hypothetical protein
VATFYPNPQTIPQAQQAITPGRIGSVLFFPEASYKNLEDERPGWGFQTAFGKNTDYRHLILCQVFFLDI